MRDSSGATGGQRGFRRVSIVAAVLFFVVGVVWMFFSQESLADWGVAPAVAATLISRRAAAPYAGLGVMFFLARNLEPSPARRAMVAGVVVTCSILVGLGLLELFSGRANSGILRAVCIEAAFCVAFLLVDRAPRGRAGLGETKQ